MAKKSKPVVESESESADSVRYLSKCESVDSSFLQELEGSDSENDYENASNSDDGSDDGELSRSDLELGDDRSDSEENYGNVAWGKQKKAYYSSNKKAESSDEEAGMFACTDLHRFSNFWLAREEETEAKRLQQAKLVGLRDEDISIGIPTTSEKKGKKKDSDADVMKGFAGKDAKE